MKMVIQEIVGENTPILSIQPPSYEVSTGNQIVWMMRYGMSKEKRFYKDRIKWLKRDLYTNPERIRYHALQEEISQLKERISKLVSKKFSIDNVSMAQANPDPVDVILTNRTAISNSL
uniref:Uncharacterized protein n=1 Tax=Rhizophagus irregularis (strain DAOM 181602 / DAOM 197198 / MUCL 43194) TaxID=747089 RepID=U9TRW8_RHIID